MWFLKLNPMRGNTEDRAIVGWAETKEELDAYLARERVEPYGDPGQSSFGLGPTTWRKVFRKGGPLEWFNPPEDIYAEDSFVDVGSREDWMERSGLKWDALRIEYRRLA